jgi:hypothetical protein
MMITKLDGMFCTAAPVSAKTPGFSVAFARTAA